MVKEIELAQVENAVGEITEDRAVAFAMYKELNTIAVSTPHNLHLFDYEDELTHMKAKPLQNVR